MRATARWGRSNRQRVVAALASRRRRDGYVTVGDHPHDRGCPRLERDMPEAVEAVIRQGPWKP